MSQDDLVLLAGQTLAICAAGVYQAPSGAQVSLAAPLAAAVAGTVMHDLADMAKAPIRRHGSMSIEVRNESTFAAVRRLVRPGSHVACLNFASAKTPGGGFQRGTIAGLFVGESLLGLANLICDLGPTRLGVCAASPCTNVYVDTSPNQSRRYCSDRCSSRANVAAYRARQKAASG